MIGKAEKDELKSGDLLGQQVTDSIRQLILSGELVPGSRIGQEELASRVGTSRIPVREALRQLENEGLVVLVPNSGAWVAKLDLEECLEVYKMRERLEPLAIGESVANLTGAQIDELERLITLVERSKGDEFLRLDREFHLACYAAAGMPRLSAMVERFWNTTQHYRRAFVGLFGPAGDWVTHCEHRLLVAAMRRRDAVETERILAAHIRRTRMELERHQELFNQSRGVDTAAAPRTGRERTAVSKIKPSRNMKPARLRP